MFDEQQTGVQQLNYRLLKLKEIKLKLCILNDKTLRIGDEEKLSSVSFTEVLITAETFLKVSNII